MGERLFYGWIIVATLFVVNFVTQCAGTLNMGLFVIPMCTELGISRGLFGWLSTSRALSGSVSGFFLGRILDRFGPRILIALSALITGLCLFGMGAATQVYHLFLSFSLIGFAGLVSAGGGFLTGVSVAKWFVRRRPMALALVTLGLGLGSVTFLPVTQFFIDGFGWRRTWFFMAIIFMAVIIPSALVFLRRQPEDMGLLPDGDPVTVAETESAGSLSVDEPVWSMPEALRTRAFWLLTASMLMSSFGMGGSLHRIPYWVELGFEPRIVSFCFSADAIGATVMIIFSGFLLNRFPARFVLAGAFASFAVAFSLMLVASTTLHLVISTVLFGLGVGTNMVCQTFLWASYYGRVFLGTIRGVTVAPVLLGVALGTPTVGYIYDFTGSYNLAWEILIGLYLLALLVMLFAKPPSKTSEKRLN